MLCRAADKLCTGSVQMRQVQVCLRKFCAMSLSGQGTPGVPTPSVTASSAAEARPRSITCSILAMLSALAAGNTNPYKTAHDCTLDEAYAAPY